jgi:hypothetical protein
VFGPDDQFDEFLGKFYCKVHFSVLFPPISFEA